MSATAAVRDYNPSTGALSRSVTISGKCARKTHIICDCISTLCDCVGREQSLPATVGLSAGRLVPRVDTSRFMRLD